MRTFIVDISGKVLKYDIALCDAIQKLNNTDLYIEFYAPLYNEQPHCKTMRLVNLVPLKYKNIESFWKRIIKTIELFINYIYIILNVVQKKPDVIHFQWFPLLEICSIERLAVKLIKILSKRTKMVLTIHNIYPHSFSEIKKLRYTKRFGTIDKLMDAYIVHTEKTKEQMSHAFSIVTERIFIVHHGIFESLDFTPQNNRIDYNNVKFIMYGNLSDYKGVDIFVEAIKGLPESYKNKIHGVIAGEMQNKTLCKRLQDESEGLNIEWYPFFLPEHELYEKIDNANVIVLPYKEISQSGVLLLALFFKRFIINSDLPTFKETLRGFSDDMFFKSENPKGLANLMMRFVDGTIDTRRQMDAIETLNNKYSWALAARKTVRLYSGL